ncbi:GSCOCG00005177001-RA-CDS [Cotesia congregata]|nr:GSCOCG00005177001-RA-CDS [Cotesia congregata]
MIANSPTSIENQIDSFLEQFKRSASRAMEDNARGSYNASSSISRSRSGNLDLEVLEAARRRHIHKLNIHYMTYVEHKKPNRSVIQPWNPHYGNSSKRRSPYRVSCFFFFYLSTMERKQSAGIKKEENNKKLGVDRNDHREAMAEASDEEAVELAEESMAPVLKQKKSKVVKESKYESTKLEDNVAQVLQRFKRGCECQDDQCFKGLNPEAVYRHRLNIAELTKAEHDMYLMGVTMACLANPNQTARHTERRRLRAQYVYQGRRVCLDAFLYLENCTHYQIKRIRKHLVTHGVTPRVHGNHGKIPHNTFSLDIYQIATEFLKSFIKEQEINQKAIKTSIKNSTAIHLPAEITRKTVHDLYKDYCKKLSPTIKVMGYSTFRRFMKVQFPHIKFAKLEFVIRPQQNQSSVEAEITETETEPEATESLHFITENADMIPIVIATNDIEHYNDSNAYFITPTHKLHGELKDVESMTGEIENGDLAVRDVADLLQHQYAIITGGKTREGCPIITFPDNGNFHNLTDLDYQRLMLYLTSVPTLQEADLGFHLIIDRRTDKWNSVKTVLIKISAFFPGLVHVAYVLRPVGFLQKAISEVSNKLFREDFKFRVIVLANVTELHDFIDKDQLTEQLGGDLPYCHTTWIQNRIIHLLVA